MEVLEAVGVNEAFHEHGTTHPHRGGDHNSSNSKSNTTTAATKPTTTTMEGAQVQQPVQPPPAPAGSGSGSGDSGRPQRPSLVTAALRHVLHAHAMAPHSFEDNFSMDQPDEEEPAEHDLEEIERRIINNEPLAAPHKQQLRKQTPQEREEFISRLKSNLGHQFQELETIETGDVSELIEDMDLDRILGMDTQRDDAKASNRPTTSILQQAQQQQQQQQQKKQQKQSQGEYKPVVSETLKMLNDTEKALHRGRQRSDSDTRTATQVSSLSDILGQGSSETDTATRTRPRSQSYTTTTSSTTRQAVPSSGHQGSPASSSWWSSWWWPSSTSHDDGSSSSSASTPAVSKQSSLEEGTQFQFDDTVPFIVAPSTIIYPPNADGTENHQQHQQQGGPRVVTQQPREERGRGDGSSGSSGRGGNVAASPSFFDTGTETTYSQEKDAREDDQEAKGGKTAKSTATTAASRTIGSAIKSTIMSSNSDDDDDDNGQGDEQQRPGVFARLEEALENVLAEMHTNHVIEPDHYNDDFGQDQVQPFIVHAITPEEWAQEHPQGSEKQQKEQEAGSKGSKGAVEQMSSLLSKSGSSKTEDEEGDDDGGESKHPVLEELENIAAQLHNFRALEPHEYNDNFSCDQPLHESVVEALTPEEWKEEIEHHLRNPPTMTTATSATGGGMTTVGDGAPNPLDIDAASLTSTIKGVVSSVTTADMVVGSVAHMMEGDDDEKFEERANSSTTTTTRVV